MKTILRLAASAACATVIACACSSPGYQRADMPPVAAPVALGKCRVYVAREAGVGGWRPVRVFEGPIEIGVIASDEYLCWDRTSNARGTGRVIFEGLDPSIGDVENVFDLPRDGGSTTYFGIRISLDTRQPVIEKLSTEDGQAMIAKRKPASPR